MHRAWRVSTAQPVEARDHFHTMHAITDTLLTLQPTLARKDGDPAKKQAAIEELRRTVPAPVLAHFLRLLACDRRGVAVVNHGVCSECHIRVPHATLHSLIDPTDLHLCENCGCYLTLAPGERHANGTAPVARRVRRRPELAMA